MQLLWTFDLGVCKVQMNVPADSITCCQHLHIVKLKQFFYA